ncbi:MAG: hypothetical protein KDC44_06625, partial [Phaeodactylibacter sp.]|nr:hypothetical protein [Phaeodactylibacter sp.]
MTRLLNRPLKAFALYALVILVISIPVYVYVVDLIWIEELDESNWLRLQYAKQQLQAEPVAPTELETALRIWGEFHPGISIRETGTAPTAQDSVYEVLRPNPFEAEEDLERFRGLRSFLELNGQAYEISIETNLEDSDETFLAVALVTVFFFVLLIVG